MNTDLVHVIPINDLREHDCSVCCFCHPRIDNGVAVHYSLDGREIAEQAVDYAWTNTS